MPATSHASKRLKRLRERAGLSVRELAEALGMRSSSYAYYEDEYKKPTLPLDLVTKVARIFRHKGIEPSEVASLAGIDASMGVADHVTKGLPLPPAHAPGFSIAQLDVRAAAGPGLEVDGIQVTGQWQFPADWIRLATSTAADRLKIISVVGDSMEPKFNPNDRVMVDIEDRRPTPPGSFVVWDGLGLVVKRVEYIAHSDPPTVLISSENQKYQAYERTLEEAYIQGRVLGKWLWS